MSTTESSLSNSSDDSSVSQLADIAKIGSLYKIASLFRQASDSTRESMIPCLKTIAFQNRDVFVMSCMPSIAETLEDCGFALQLSVAKTILSLSQYAFPADLSKKLCHVSMKIIDRAISEFVECQPGIDPDVISQVVELYSCVFFVCVTSAEWSSLDIISMIRFFDHLCAPTNTSTVVTLRDSIVKAATNFLCGIITIEMDPTYFALEVSTRVLRLFLAVANVRNEFSGYLCKMFARALAVITEEGRPQSYLNTRVWEEITRIWDQFRIKSSHGKEDSVSATSRQSQSFAGASLGKRFGTIFSLSLPRSMQGEHTFAMTRQDALEAIITLSGFSMREGRASQYAMAIGNSIANFVMEQDHGSTLKQGEESNILFMISKDFSIVSQLFSTDEQNLTCIQAFEVLSKSFNPAIRKNCASHLPSVAARVFHPSKRRRKSQMRAVFNVLWRLAHDKQIEVRAALANVFHNSVGYLLEGQQKDIFDLVHVFLSDHSPVVLHSFLAHLYAIIDVLSEVKHQDSSVIDVKMLLSIDFDTVEGQRSAEKFADQVGMASSFWNAKEKGILIDILVRLLGNKSIEARNAAGEAFLRFVRTASGTNEGKELVFEFCSKVYVHGQTRKITLVDILITACKKFSAHSYREYFALQLFALSADYSAYVRLKVAQNLHAVSNACYMMPQFVDVVESLMNDYCPIVQDEMNHFPSRTSILLSQESMIVFDNETYFLKDATDFDKTIGKGRLSTWRTKHSKLIFNVTQNHSWHGRLIRISLFFHEKAENFFASIIK